MKKGNYLQTRYLTPSSHTKIAEKDEEEEDEEEGEDVEEEQGKESRGTSVGGLTEDEGEGMEEDDFEAQRAGAAASLAGAAASSGSGSGSRSSGVVPKPKAVRPDASTTAFTQYKSVVAKLRVNSTILQGQIEKVYQEGNGNPLNAVVKNTYAFLNGNLSEGCGFNTVFDASGELAPPSKEVGDLNLGK